MYKEAENDKAHEKERLRAEIDAHVREFLERGGRIDVVIDNPRSNAAFIGSVGYQPDTSLTDF